MPINVKVWSAAAADQYRPYRGLCAYTDSDMAMLPGLTGTTYVRRDWPTAAFVTAAKTAGVDVLPIAAYDVTGGGAKAYPSNLTAWLNALTTDLTGAWQNPRAVEIWNEPWQVGFWGPIPDPAQYLSLVVAAANAIWAINPSTLILVSSDTNGSTNTSGTILWRQYLLAADTTGFLNDSRIRPTTHNYCNDRSPSAVTGQPSYWDYQRYTYAFNDYLAHGHTNPQVWITEYGWETITAGQTVQSGPAISEAAASGYTTQALQISRASGMVEQQFLFYLKTGDPYAYNVLRSDILNTAKPVAAAMKALV
jgi:hypothetical protein